MTVFDDELQHLKEKLLKMGSLVDDAIKYPIQSLVERDNALAERIIEHDRMVNTLDVEIDEESIRLIALRQPKAGDLRLAWNPSTYKMQLVVRGMDDGVWISNISAAGIFNNDWVKLTGETPSAPAMVWNPTTGKTTLIVRGMDGDIWKTEY